MTKRRIKKKIKVTFFVLLILCLLGGYIISKEIKKDEKTKEQEVVKTEEEPKEQEVIKTEEEPKEQEVVKTEEEHKIETIDGITYIDGIMIANKTYGLPEKYYPKDTYESAKGIYKETCKKCLTNETYEAFLSLQSEAATIGYKLDIASGYRSYGYQESLYNGYVKNNGQKSADLGSARPGYSEHQTGLAFDLNTINDSNDTSETTKWVLNNCYKYGLILRYPNNKTNETGYKYEWWHLRYVGEELATLLYNEGNWITLEDYFDITSEYK